MTTKFLARTVIEGGRARYNKLERRSSHRTCRVQTRLANGLALSDVEDLEWPTLEPVYKGFDDKLGPARRFLESRVGRSWAKVYSELRQKFDTRTTAGRHIVFDHMLPWVQETQDRWPRTYFCVDAQGRLKRVQRNPRQKYWQSPEPLPESKVTLDAWVGSRAIGGRGSSLYWFEVTRMLCFRQARELTPAEAKRYQDFPAWYREEISPEKRREAIVEAKKQNQLPAFLRPARSI
jgi:site-specific DNA-cytosine methylase